MEYIISLKPHLKKFLLKKSQTQEPIKIESHDYLGDVFVSLGLASNRGKKPFLNKEQYPSTLVFEFNRELSRCQPTDRDLLDINKRLEKIFKESMYEWALCAIAMGSFSSKGIKAFLSYYNVENHYSWDTAYRAWMRYYHKEYEREKVSLS